MSYGKVVIASSCDGIPEDIKDLHTGLLVPRASVSALANAIATVLKNPKLARSLGHNAKLQFHKHHQFTMMYADVKDLLTKASLKSK